MPPRSAARESASRPVSDAYRPASMPIASGDQQSTPTPCRRHIGSSSFSIRRSSRLYGDCSETTRTTPFSSAVMIASMTCQAGDVDVPTYRTLPGADEVVQGAERLVQRHVHVGPVRLVQVDVVEPQPLQRLLAGADQVQRASCRGRSGPGPVG